MATGTLATDTSVQSVTLIQIVFIVEISARLVQWIRNQRRQSSSSFVSEYGRP